MDIKRLKKLIDISIETKHNFFKIPTPNEPNLFGKGIWIIPGLVSSSYSVDADIGIYDQLLTLTLNCTESSSASGYMEATNKNIDTEIVSRVEIIGDHGSGFRSAWNCSSSCWPSKYLFESSSVLKDIFRSSTVFSELTILRPRTATFYNAIAIMVEILKPDPESVKPIVELNPEPTGVTTTKMYMEMKFADVEILVMPAEAKEIYKIMVHKAILAARSKVFEAMFQPKSKMKENRLSQIRIVDFEQQVIAELIKYLYTGEANFADYALELLKCADKYDIEELMDLTQKFIAAYIPKFGWTVIFELIRTYGDGVSILRTYTKTYYKRHEHSLKKSEDFQTAIKMFPDIFIELFYL